MNPQNPKWLMWLKRLHEVTGIIAMQAGRDLPLPEFVTELRKIADEMQEASSDVFT